MSYILEALKRSEQERQQQLRPGSFDPEGGILHLRKRQTPVWVYLLVLVLLLNLGLMLGLYWDKLTAPEPVSEQSLVIERGPELVLPADNMPVVRTPVIETPQAPVMPSRRQVESEIVESTAASASAVSAQAGQFSQAESYTYIEPERSDQAMQETMPAVDEALSQDGIVSDETEVWDIVAPVSGRQAPTEREPDDTSQRPAPIIQKPAMPKPVKPVMLADTTPLLQTFDGGFTSQIPPIAFNSHIYSQSPEARRVMINNIYLREGEGFSGLTVLEIGEEYVVFDKQGRQFKLPVMKDWNP